ncbi:hypothetical protein L917_00106, partial [Phytophthora nicotianae]
RSNYFLQPYTLNVSGFTCAVFTSLRVVTLDTTIALPFRVLSSSSLWLVKTSLRTLRASRITNSSKSPSLCASPLVRAAPRQHSHLRLVCRLSKPTSTLRRPWLAARFRRIVRISSLIGNCFDCICNCSIKSGSNVSFTLCEASNRGTRLGRSLHCRTTRIASNSTSLTVSFSELVALLTWW